jgi:hypothetical protein
MLEGPDLEVVGKVALLSDIGELLEVDVLLIAGGCRSAGFRCGPTPGSQPIGGISLSA